MQEVISLHWPCQVDWKSVDEDAFIADEEHCVFVVADGVTRRGFTDSYPNPSPAHLAAKAAVEALRKTLAEHGEQLTGVQIQSAFAKANEHVREINQRLELWNNHDWWGNDLAGTVASCLVVKKTTFFYGFMADCGVAHLAPNGGLLWHSPDLLAPVTKYFPSIEELGEKERFIRVRRDFRNKPQANHPTYGVLTGEEEALSYVQVGSRPYNPGEVLAVYSDGAAPFVVDDAAFRQLLPRGKESDIHEYVAQRSPAKQNPDEKTLIVVRT